MSRVQHRKQGREFKLFSFAFECILALMKANKTHGLYLNTVKVI